MSRSRSTIAAALVLLGGPLFARQQSGSIRGIVLDLDFQLPLAGVLVTNLETGQAATTGAQGNYLLTDVVPGAYTLIFSKEGYVRQIKANVLVTAGQLTDVDASLAGEFTDMEEFVVEDLLRLGAGSEAALLQLRFETPALVDSIGADLMSRAGASDAAAALKLVAGASVQDGKSAVIRGLPDRYVSSQMNGVRLPSADEDKRAVELDQFPAAVIESIQVSKTFTPDQQGDATGGAVNVLLRGVPERTVLEFKSEVGYNANTSFYDDFLSYEGGGIDTFARGNGGRSLQPIDTNWTGALATSEESAPLDYKFGLNLGTRYELGDDVRVGAFATVFYERDSTYHDNGRDDSLIRYAPDQPLTPEIVQGSVGPDNTGDYRTALFDITQGSQLEQYGGLAALGLETEKHQLELTYLYTSTTEDTATLAIDTRGKQFFFPGHDPLDPTSPGSSDLLAAPYIRTETLEYTERIADTLQLGGRNELPLDPGELGGLKFRAPELDWVLAHSTAIQDQPDKRQFAAIWEPFGTGIWEPYKPSQTSLLGNVQRTFRELEEESDQYQLNLKLPFEQRNGRDGYAKFGLYDDRVDRTFDQDSFSNFDDNSSFFGTFDQPWSEVFPDELNHPTSDGPPFQDVDYDGEQDIFAWYGMIEVPLSAPLSLVTGVRFESTEINTVLDPEDDALWLDPNSTVLRPENLVDQSTGIYDGRGDASLDQDDVLPAIGLTYQPIPSTTFRAAYSETIARPTFKELTPVLQQEFIGGPAFAGNPGLRMSSLENYDLRVDYAPVDGTFLSLSWFHKDVEDAIEYVRRVFGFSFTQPRNYPEGQLDGYELEVRQHLGRLRDDLDGIQFGANATFIDSEVTLPDDEALLLANAQVPTTTRDATNAPAYLYNLFLTYETESLGTQVGLFYTVQGDTLIAAGGTEGNTVLFVPDIYQKAFGTLNFTLSHRLGEHWILSFQAKNLTDPDIETVYRSDAIGGDVTKSSYSSGREFSISLGVRL